MESPFNMIIVGITACGKTKYLLDMLVNEYMNQFDFINMPNFRIQYYLQNMELFKRPGFFSHSMRSGQC